MPSWPRVNGDFRGAGEIMRRWDKSLSKPNRRCYQDVAPRLYPRYSSALMLAQTFQLPVASRLEKTGTYPAPKQRHIYRVPTTYQRVPGYRPRYLSEIENQVPASLPSIRAPPMPKRFYSILETRGKTWGSLHNGSRVFLWSCFLGIRLAARMPIRCSGLD